MADRHFSPSKTMVAGSATNAIPTPKAKVKVFTEPKVLSTADFTLTSSSCMAESVGHKARFIGGPTPAVGNWPMSEPKV